MRAALRSPLWRLTQAAVSIALIIWLIRSIDTATLTALDKLDTGTLTLATLLFASAQIFGGLRLALLFSGQVSRRAAIAVTWIGYFLSNFLPGTIGGDVVKAARLRAGGLSLATAAGGLVLDRLLNTAAIVLTAAVTAAPDMLRVFGQLHSHAVVLAGLAVMLSLGLLIAILGRNSRTKEILHRAAEPLTRLAQSPRRWIGAILLSFLNIGVAILAQWLVARDLGISISLPQMAGIACFVTLLVMLPVSLNGIGLQEAGFVVLLMKAGAEEPAAAIFAIIVRLMIVLASLIGGVFLFLDRGGRQNQASKASSPASGESC